MYGLGYEIDFCPSEIKKALGPLAKTVGRPRPPVSHPLLA